MSILPPFAPSMMNPLPSLSDGASYIRILRVTIDEGAEVSGEIGLTIDPDAPPQGNATLLRTIPALPR